MKILETVRRYRSYLWMVLAAAAAILLLRLTLLAPPAVAVVTPERRDLTAQVYGNGTVEAKVLVGVSSKITGRIVGLYVDQGARVRRGQLLARLEGDDFSEQVRQSEANVLKARASQVVEAATARKAVANLDLAERNARRYRGLADADLVARAEAEQYETAYEVAREEVNRSRAALEAARTEEAASRAGQGVARSRLKDTLVYAPQDGVIVSRDLEMGAIVTPGQSIFTLVDPETVWVKANVDESFLAGVTVGEKALITLRSAPGRQFVGRVARLAHQSDRVTEELEVDVAFVQPLQSFRVGEQAEVLIEAGTRRNVLSLPSSAIVAASRQRGVWVEEQGKVRFRPVTTGIEDRRNFTELVSGVAGNERIVAGPQAAIAKFKDGQKVRGR